MSEILFISLIILTLFVSIQTHEKWLSIMEIREIQQVGIFIYDV